MRHSCRSPYKEVRFTENTGSTLIVWQAAVPENYEDRLVEMFPGAYQYLRLLALDPYDIALSKLERNSQKDRDDVRFLSRSIPFDLEILQQRYEAELRWQLGRPDREDLTMKLRMEMLSE